MNPEFDMELFSCFFLVGRKKKLKGDEKSSPDVHDNNGLRTLKVKLEHPVKVKSSEHVEFNSTSFDVSVPYDIPGNSSCKVKPMNSESPVEKEVVEVAYEGEDEWDNKSPIRKENSDCNLQVLGSTDMDSIDHFPEEEVNENSMNKCEKEAYQSGHVSDPGMEIERWASPKLQRSCSSLDTREVLKKIGNQLPPSKCQSFEELQELAKKATEDAFMGTPCSQSSALTHRSADKVMLKKHSSSQILPSRSRKLWWKLFLWSHRNLQKPTTIAKTRVSQLANLNQQGGYSSDTLEPGRARKLSKLEPPSPFSETCSYKSDHMDHNNEAQRWKWNAFQDRVSGLWPQNQWVAFSASGESSPLKRVDDWVKELDIQSTTPSIEGENGNINIIFPPSPEASASVAKGTTHLSRYGKVNLSAEVLHANSVIQSLNASSTVAHISGIGLKVVPIMSHFSSLRSINLSNNAIVQITPGSLPKGLHVLDLSKNKINAIEGLRELTRLRVLDLSFNRISRIGHGLANCTLLKELYLSGNKISEMEGLHRLLKLTVVDLSFNKITTTKALGQLVANYNSLLGLNLLGNPIQGNLSDDQLRKAVCGLLPKLAYLNKQPINQQKAREVSMDIVAKASSRSSDWSARRKSVKKASQGGAFLSTSARSNASIAQRSRNKLKTRTSHHSGKPRTSTAASMLGVAIN